MADSRRGGRWMAPTSGGRLRGRRSPAPGSSDDVPTPSAASPSTPSSTTPTASRPSASAPLHGAVDTRIELRPGDTRHEFNVTHGVSDRLADIIRNNFTGPWPTWSQVPDDHKTLWWQTFQESYRWDPRHEREIRRLFNHKGAKLMKNIMDKLRRGIGNTDWCQPDIEAALNQIWDSPQWQHRSDIARRNRAVDSGASSYTGGSISATEHRNRFIAQHGREPTAMEVMEQTKRMRDGSWVCDKAKGLADAFEARRSELEGSGGGSSAENALFLELVGGKGKKGNVWSQGDLGDLLLSQGSPSSTAHTSAPTEREAMMENQIQELTAQMQEYRSDRESILQALQTATTVAAEASRAAKDASRAAQDASKAAAESQRYIMELRQARMPPPPVGPSSSSLDDSSSDSEE